MGGSGNFGTDRSFTGQTADAVSGLYWYKRRYYDPAIGRFCQPDTVVPGASNPRAWNRYAYALNNPVRYAYALNNPVRYADPTGRDPSRHEDGAVAVAAPTPTAMATLARIANPVIANRVNGAIPSDD